MNHPESLPVGNRERLLQAARELFLEQGYDASVEAIISRAGVARQTFYNHFENKQSLFTEAVRCCVADIIAPLSANLDQVRDSLLNFAQAYRQRALSPDGLAIHRTLISQAQRFPELIRELAGLSDVQMSGGLTAFLQHAMAAGQLRGDDPQFAAETLMAMLVNQERTQGLLGVVRPAVDETQRTAQIVDGFLRMFAPDARR